MLIMSISITILIIIATTLISFKAFKEDVMFSQWAFSAYRIKHFKENKRFFSYMFIHADVPHLLFNMISFFMFGEMLEHQFQLRFSPILGEIHFVLLYFLGGIFATFIPLYRNQNNSNYISVGASGAVSAIVFATILWNPTMEVGFLFLPFPIPAYIFGPLYLAFEYWAFKKSKSNIAHDAHLGGALFGILYVLVINSEKGSDFLQLIIPS